MLWAAIPLNNISRLFTSRLEAVKYTIGSVILRPIETLRSGQDTMFVKGMAKTNMLGFWQYIFDYCNEQYSCVLGWIMIGILGFLVVLIGLFFMMKRLNRRE
jgi:hypothetical protein